MSESDDQPSIQKRGIVLRWNYSSIELALLVVTGALAFAGEQLSVPFLTSLALPFAGLLLMVFGTEQITTRLGVYRGGVANYAQAVETYKALVEQLWGLIFIGLGLMLIASGALEWLGAGSAESIWVGILDSPTGVGLVLAGIGLMTILHGLIRMLAGSGEANVGRLRGLTDLLDRVAGGGTLVLGVMLSFVGFVLLVAPDLVTGFIARLGNLIAGP